MVLFLLTAGLMAIIMSVMAIGVIFSGKELQGSCGGAGSTSCACERAGRPKACEEQDGRLSQVNEALQAYQASRSDEPQAS